MTRQELQDYLARGRDTLAAGFVAWPMRAAFGAVAIGSAAAMASLSSAVMPPENITPSAWAQKFRYISAESGSPRPGKWDNATTPQLVEPLDALGPDHPATGVVAKMAAQVGKTDGLGVNWFGFTAHIDRKGMLITQAGLAEVNKFNRFKLQPAIDSTPILLQIIEPESDKSGKGSTSTFKSYPGGGCVLASALSSGALQGITRARYWGDEVSEYPAEAGSRGDPVAQAIKRMDAWGGLSKYLLTSTCQYKDSCRISREYDKSDRRKYYVPCPHCGDYHLLEFDNLHWSTNDAGAAIPAFTCPSCGSDIPEHHKAGMNAKGRWIATFPSTNPDNPAPPPIITPEALPRWLGRDREGKRIWGYHLWKAYSNLADWGSILVEYEDAEGDPEAQKVFWQQTLAEPWDEAGEAPDHEALAKLVEGYPDKTIPPGAYFTTGAADVQKDRIEWAVYAWGPHLQGWLVDKGIISGDTDQTEVWREFRELMATAAYPYPSGLTLPVDLWGCDSGYRSPWVYQALRGVPNALILDGRGRDNPHAPPLGQPKTIPHKMGGKLLGKVQKYDVGTYGLKTRMYGMLRQWEEGPGEDGSWPRGVVHFGAIADAEFFAQVTAETLVPHMRRGGRIDYYWQKTKNRANEHHDILIYNLALACHLRWDVKKPKDWQGLIAERGGEPAKEQASLEDLWGPSKMKLAEGVAESKAMPRNARLEALSRLSALNKNLQREDL